MFDAFDKYEETTGDETISAWDALSRKCARDTSASDAAILKNAHTIDDQAFWRLTGSASFQIVLLLVGSRL